MRDCKIIFSSFSCAPLTAYKHHRISHSTRSSTFSHSRKNIYGKITKWKKLNENFLSSLNVRKCDLVWINLQMNQRLIINFISHVDLLLINYDSILIKSYVLRSFVRRLIWFVILGSGRHRRLSLRLLTHSVIEARAFQVFDELPVSFNHVIAQSSAFYLLIRQNFNVFRLCIVLKTKESFLNS